MFKEKEIKKIYHAIVKNKPPENKGTIKSYIKKNTKQNKSYTYNKYINGAKEAILHYKIISKSDSFYLLEITLETGRHHQIRAQLSSINCPIKGDLKYGYRRANFDKSINLHARKISFQHPVKKNILTITAPYPKEKTWNFFN
jgi:23S rRNA pseudouridine1911/1915/1917 synthase